MKLLCEIAPGIADFFARQKMQVVVKDSEQASFGNAVVELALSDFDLRIVRDRGQVVMDVSPSGRKDWHSMENVLAFICQEPQIKIEDSEKGLSENFEKIAALMTSDLVNVGFIDFEKQRSASFLQKLFPPK